MLLAQPEQSKIRWALAVPAVDQRGRVTDPFGLFNEPVEAFGPGVRDAAGERDQDGGATNVRSCRGVGSTRLCARR